MLNFSKLVRIVVAQAVAVVDVAAAAVVVIVVVEIHFTSLIQLILNRNTLIVDKYNFYFGIWAVSYDSL